MTLFFTSCLRVIYTRIIGEIVLIVTEDKKVEPASS